ncbi:alpha/beta hydrolase [Dasania sp. GY-MA-18]|uniref:Alpha/beta hydrolase n=1 Tax=Dasania phycosphaerae TaxID=2950436 RepID=A0A9J6RLQ9_9GAMM|nr:MULTISPECIES: alpha/beta hydrolase [Dasania]MCR8922883.1 alpha/beta hydrolase [Dasania sp. GY-MA-18]MCZ0865314.1 alpha/beta hydrolase [Dasania phycosphaerae]MCZ0869039.1 alpha/beta hydrolase [Dasania phycosphaerae]
MSDNKNVNYQAVWYQSNDGLKLYARDYVCQRSNQQAKATILCLHGLTRNSADFDFICSHLSKDYRLIAADQRGRGLSSYDPQAENYHPGIYVQDMLTLLNTLSIPKVILLGTSLGGLMSLMLSAMVPERITASILNDVGPELDASGLARIQEYVGKQTPVTNWQQAVVQARKINAKELPDLNASDWESFTRAIYRENEQGQPVLAYDPAIAQLMNANKTTAAPPDLWPLFELIAHKPLLLIRGQTSDILTLDCVHKMQSIKPTMEYCEVANRGHAPLLNEPQSLTAIEQFLQKTTTPAAS